MNDIAATWSICRKDILQELRSKAVTVATIFFSANVLFVLALALGAKDVLLQNAAAGVLWVALAFAGMISASQSYQNELEDGALEQLLLYPVPRAAIYLGKLLANWLLMMFLGVLMIPFIVLLFDVQLGASWPWLLATIALGTLGYALIACFYAALTANVRARESLLPILMFPIVIPVLLSSVRSTSELIFFRLPDGLLYSGDLAIASDWLKLLLAFDLTYIVVCTAMFHFVVQE